MKRYGKKYVEASKKVEKNKLYTCEEAVKLVKETSITKFELERIRKIKDKDLFLELSSSKTGKKSILTIWGKNLELGKTV